MFDSRQANANPAGSMTNLRFIGRQGAVAQLAERASEKGEVAGSFPARTTTDPSSPTTPPTKGVRHMEGLASASHAGC